MVKSERLGQVPATGTYPYAPGGPYDAAFNTRWTAWVDRGRVHERRARRRFVTRGAALAFAAAIVYALLTP